MKTSTATEIQQTKFLKIILEKIFNNVLNNKKGKNQSNIKNEKILELQPNIQPTCNHKKEETNIRKLFTPNNKKETPTNKRSIKTKEIGTARQQMRV